MEAARSEKRVRNLDLVDEIAAAVQTADYWEIEQANLEMQSLEELERMVALAAGVENSAAVAGIDLEADHIAAEMKGKLHYWEEVHTAFVLVDSQESPILTVS